jgi:uncharacterized membrane protein
MSSSVRIRREASETGYGETDAYQEGACVPIQIRSPRINVGEAERFASVLGGVAFASYGLRKASLGGELLALLGAMLVHRGLTGHCPLLQAFGIRTTSSS